MNKPEIKIAYINPNTPQKTRTKEDALLIETTATNVQLINTNLNILLKEIGKAGMLENGVVLSRINAIKQLIYLTQDSLKESA